MRGWMGRREVGERVGGREGFEVRLCCQELHVDMGVKCALLCTACVVWTSLLAPAYIIENNPTKLHLFDCDILCSFGILS